MTWPEVGAVFKRRPNLVILPVGALEQHGHHLPLGTDSIMVDALCGLAAAGLEQVVVAPGLHYGTSANHDAFPGTVSVGLDTLVRLIVDIGLDLFRQGVDILLIVNGHGGNTQAVAAAAHELRQRSGKVVAQLMWTATIHDSWNVLEGDISWHADESETSLMLAFAPELVREGKAVDERPRTCRSSSSPRRRSSPPRWTWGSPKTDALSASGTIGLAKLATRAKGETMVSEATKNLRSTITQLLEHHGTLLAHLTRTTE